jgi:hypothetical protein
MQLSVKIFTVVLIVLLSSCGSGDRKARRSQMVPARDLVPLLTDLYLADGLLAYQPVKNIFNAKDSILNYIDIIGKHGYTKEQVDNTLKYYFVQNPKKLQKIYDQVLSQLTEIESEIVSNTPSRQVFNLWNQKSSIRLPEDGIHNPLFFSIPIKDTGMYTFTFDYLLFNDDQSLNPRTVIYFWYSDDTEQGVKDPWESVELTRDGTRHNYFMSRRLTDTAFTHISGYLHDCDQQSVRWEKHSTFSNILLYKGEME